LGRVGVGISLLKKRARRLEGSSVTFLQSREREVQGLLDVFPTTIKNIAVRASKNFFLSLLAAALNACDFLSRVVLGNSFRPSSTEF
jgi:hypothetical protein